MHDELPYDPWLYSTISSQIIGFARRDSFLVSDFLASFMCSTLMSRMFHYLRKDSFV